MPICKNCNEEFPNFLEIAGKLRNLSKRKFCVSCSPFGSNNRKSVLIDGIRTFCASCKKEKEPSEFYHPYGKMRKAHSYCKECQRKQMALRLRLFKEKCLEYKGGGCENCGYNKCPSALEFHHRNPLEKEFSISEFNNRAFDEKVKQELDKCDLLCSNCHREVHWELNNI